MMTDTIIKQLPPMLTGNELKQALIHLPNYDETLPVKSKAERLVALSDLYQIFIPSEMAIEIYNRLYLSLLRSFQKKTEKSVISQYYENADMIVGTNHNSIIGGADSFTVIGTSGIGKSTAINKAIGLITQDNIINISCPHTRIIPCIVVQCPFDASVKGLLYEILRKIDEALGSDYYNKALKIRASTDMLIGSVSQAAINHIGLLVVDEIQNAVNNKNGKRLIGMLTQLINNSGISICMVGTQSCTEMFESEMQLARRSLGLNYTSVPYNRFFHDFCRILLSYQYTESKTDITDSLISWIYEHSSGIISVVVSLIHDAQELAILSGTEVLNIDTLTKAYNKRLSMLHGFIKPASIKNTRNTKSKTHISTAAEQMPSITISEIITKAKETQLDVINQLRKYIAVEVIRI